jgi:hypothetical protein
MWDFKNADFDKFRHELADINFEAIIDVNEASTAAKEFSDKFLEVAKNSIPNKLVTVRPSDKPWFKGELRKLLRRKNRAHRKAKLHNTPELWATFRSIRNLYLREINKCKSDYLKNKYTELTMHQNINTKRWWNMLKETLGQTNDSAFPPMEVDNQIIVDDRLKAEAFNKFFAKSSDVDDSGHNLPDQEFINVEPLINIEIEESEVMDQLNNINTKKAYGPDGLPPRLIKEAKRVISKPLTMLFNKSLSTASFPELWKRANVLPIFKKGAKNIMGNYRPVSLLCVNAKIFEKIIFKHLYNHFKDNFLISIWQSGFRPAMSTVTQLIELHHSFCNAVSNGKEIRVVFLDISKAFDRVWHKGLLWKLKKFGIQGALFDWIADYLKDRCQRVIINGQCSQWTKIKAGVPQGSNLGPLLFLIFINDIVHVIRHCQIRLFADDTCLFITVDNREEAARMINEDTSRIEAWAHQWLVTFGPHKTETLLVSNKGTLQNHPDLYLGDHLIKSVNEHNHLGIILSHDLKWKAHINELVSKCSKLINITKKFKYTLDRKSLETIYLSIIRPKMEYGDVLFAGTYEIDLDKLDQLQIEAMRVVTGATAKSNIDLLYEDLNWAFLKDRRNHHCLSMMYKIVHGQTPQYLLDLLPQRQEIPGRRNLRSETNNQLLIPFTRTESFRRAFIPYSARLWNSLDKNVRESPSLEIFKNSFKTEAIANSELFYLGPRWPAIHHARLRIGCSKLNAHLYHNLHVIQSPQCVCGYPQEDPQHFFFNCPCFNTQRGALLNTVGLVSNNINERMLLYGDPDISFDDNRIVFDAVLKFINQTDRFV